MNDIKKLIRELRRVKAQYGLMTISTIIEDVPANDFVKFANENKLNVTHYFSCSHALYTPESGIDISIFSKKVSPVVEIGNEDFDAYDEKAQG